jgi:hypothetical protein
LAPEPPLLATVAIIAPTTAAAVTAVATLVAVSLNLKAALGFPGACSWL